MCLISLKHRGMTAGGVLELMEMTHPIALSKSCLLVLEKGKGQPHGVSEQALSGVQTVLWDVGEGILGTSGWWEGATEL